ncbi:hypothetical protein SISNIDRAFT_482056 [Sistotremastrum niveocremeum HHB9708]|nr:hypothetical protein SISNIDRAFT_482056 [Sistotremastrum niveocremeum HHB9708]
MSFTNGALDSSPIALPKRPDVHPGPSMDRAGTPKIQRGLKRSASTASLLTPPRTVTHNRKSRRLEDGGRSEDDEMDDGEECEGGIAHGVVGQLNFGGEISSGKTLDVSLDDEENPFWSGSVSSTTTLAAPLTPPRSRRQQPLPPPLTVDASENPFLETPLNPLDDSSSESSRVPQAADDNIPIDANGERKYIYMVFKGRKILTLNPYYNYAPEVDTSKLPISHPDYAPSAILAPKVLFPKVKSASKSQTRKTPLVRTSARTRTRVETTDGNWSP